MSTSPKKSVKKTPAQLGFINDDTFVLRFGDRGISLRFADEERDGSLRHLEALTNSIGMLTRALGYVPEDAHYEGFDKRPCLDAVEFLAAMACELATRAAIFDETVGGAQ